MDKYKLELLNLNLKNSFVDYCSMIATGSIVVGDPWIEGRSDVDILIVFNSDSIIPFNNIEEILKNFNFEEYYVFTPILKKEFGKNNSKYSFSNKFRSKTLFGEDLVSLSKLPSKEEALKNAIDGLHKSKERLKNYIVNSRFWDIDKVREKFWKQFKHIFMWLSVKIYCDKGIYPQNRKEVVKVILSKRISKMYEILHLINNKTKEEIVNCSKEIVNYIEEFI